MWHFADIVYWPLTQQPNLKFFKSNKDRSVLSNLNKRTVLKTRLCIIYLKYRSVFDRNISRVVAVPTLKKNGQNKKDMFMQKHTSQRVIFLKTAYGVSAPVHWHIFLIISERPINAIALITHGVIILNRSNNSVFLYLKIF